MCGIAGLYHLKREAIPAHCLKNMCDAIEHRGPDDEGYAFHNITDGPYKDEGYWVEKSNSMPVIAGKTEWNQLFSGNGHFNLALGHRRLAIIDLSPAGHQPMSNSANNIWITYNGEIYNFKELRQRLEREGHRFFSRTDTEVIIHLYEEYGIDAIRQLNGIFAFALWDGKKKNPLIKH